MTAAPTPELQHIALLITGYLEREGITASDLGRRLGGSVSVAHPWIYGQGAPSPVYRAKLAGRSPSAR